MYCPLKADPKCKGFAFEDRIYKRTVCELHEDFGGKENSTGWVCGKKVNATAEALDAITKIPSTAGVSGATCSAIGDCGRAYQGCCTGKCPVLGPNQVPLVTSLLSCLLPPGYAAKGYPCGCHLTDGAGAVGNNCGDCGTAFHVCCAGFAAKGYPW